MESNYSFQQEDAYVTIVNATRRYCIIEIKTSRCVQYKVALKRGNFLLTKRIAFLTAQLSRHQDSTRKKDPSLLRWLTKELETAKLKASIEEWSPVRNNDRSFRIVAQYPTTVKPPYETCMVPGPNLSSIAMDALPCIRNLVKMVLEENHFKTFPRDIHFRILSNKEGFYLLCKNRESTAKRKRKQVGEVPTFDGYLYAFDARNAKVLVDSRQSVAYFGGASGEVGISMEGYTTLLYQKKPALVDAARTFFFGKHVFRCCVIGPDAPRFIHQCRNPNTVYKTNPERRQVCIWAKEKNEVMYLSEEEEEGANAVVFCVAKEPTKEEEQQFRDLQGIKKLTFVLDTGDNNLPFVNKLEQLKKDKSAQIGACHVMRCNLGGECATRGVRNVVQRIMRVCKTSKGEYQEQFSPHRTGVENRGCYSDDVLYPEHRHWQVLEEEFTVMKRIENMFPSMYEQYNKKKKTYGVGGGTRLRDLLSIQEREQVVQHLLPICEGTAKHTGRLIWLGECTVRSLRKMKQRYVVPVFPPKTQLKRFETLIYKPLGDLSVRFQLYQYNPGDEECMRDKYGMIDGSLDCPTTWWYYKYGRCRVVPKDGMDPVVFRLAIKVVQSRYWKRLRDAQLQLKKC